MEPSGTVNIAADGPCLLAEDVTDMESCLAAWSPVMIYGMMMHCLLISLG